MRKQTVLSEGTQYPDDLSDISITKALAWAILVESALLNQRLNEDLQRVSQDPNCDCTLGNGPIYRFYLPSSHPESFEARQVFIKYVQCRWPIHVFAVDPVTQDQNVSDVFSLRREMQIAVALAASSGKINVNNLTRYVRRIETDMQTVALNQTVVGFSHGPDTFGWRFLPRFQTPEIKGNAEVFFRDLLIGDRDRDADLRDYRLEPGTRECVALVVMPSFLDHVTFDFRSNWFQLVPGCLSHRRATGPKLEEVACWSSKIQEVEELTAVCLGGEGQPQSELLGPMLTRVGQLKREMPMQEMHARVPNGNTIGGFQMFSSGVTDLGPELIGFYGHPGIDPSQETVLFLVGRNLSVHETRVIAGNRDVQFDLLSREVMRAVIPPGVTVMKCQSTRNHEKCPTGCTEPCPQPEETVVDVHLATPYGVSSHLHIPVVSPSLAGWQPLYPLSGNNEATYRYKTVDNSGFVININGVSVPEPMELAFQAPPSPIGYPAGTMEMIFTLEMPVTASGRSIPAGTVVGSVAATNSVAARYDHARNAFVIDKANFVAFHTHLSGAVAGFLNSSFDPKKEVALPNLNLKVQAVMNFTGPPIMTMPVTAFTYEITLKKQ